MVVVPDALPPRYLVVMGVSGCGKSTVAALLASRLGWPFLEADALHPLQNIEKMRSGIPLTDADRAPWLAEIAAALAAWRAAGNPGITACSALRRSYRETIAGGHADILFIHLAAPPDIMRQRMALRRGHFMPAALLDSQYATLEPPGAGECALTLNAALEPEALAAAVLRQLGAGAPPAGTVTVSAAVSGVAPPRIRER